MSQLEEEKKKGNIAYLKHDKLIVKKPGDNSRDKRRREPSDSPDQTTQFKSDLAKKVNHPRPKMQKNTIIRPNILNYVEKTRSDPCPNSPKN
ncbi:hypothetical protein HW555_000171 [Spodoptera exigua]|nr:hypothetical protein HW555_013577 [Spodoptera exigua]KAF9415443.1 hypothetical protein HW555_006865 [Spodoptera exigua]KAF9424870.1 hypothetical protein HW555_000171 [Spodoptera exigua]